MDVLQGTNAKAYFDDILVCGRNIQEHDENLKQVLHKLQEEGITLNKEKSIIAAKELTFLRHVINGNGVAADPQKVKAIVGMTAAKNRNCNVFLECAIIWQNLYLTSPNELHA
ncbi:Reverse transcriptase (RNA-dependent DNA polymerase) [Popillia japonica]|uniref:Reverse transcriptase (RNA-dependent DNA polymerase) n=1 Tax=Popillia japonica TaxID=7064 RepID=A0AAW1KHU9_POPJA